ncbi:hypothetical protein V8E51_006001 [Hyaloscypha variabilis]
MRCTIHGTLPLCAASAGWTNSTVFDVESPYSRLHAPARSAVSAVSACLFDVAWPLNHALPINARPARCRRRRVIDPSRPSPDASSAIQSRLLNTSSTRTVIWKINDSTSSHLAPANPIHVPSCPHALVPSGASDSSTQTLTLSVAHAFVSLQS